MTTLLADDEASARSRLRRLLKAHSDLAVVGEAQDGLETVEKIEKLRPELLFLDIEMPGLGGFDVLRALPESAPVPLVIFATGYDQHAMAAFEANALAYLLKPVDPDRLAPALERARRLHASAAEGEAAKASLLRTARAAPANLRQLVCRKLGRAYLFPPDEIHWFEVTDGLVRARTASESFTVNHPLNELEQALPPDRFFRARRDILVNLDRIREVRPTFKSGFVLVMADAASVEIEVSERRVPHLRRLMPGL